MQLLITVWDNCLWQQSPHLMFQLDQIVGNPLVSLLLSFGLPMAMTLCDITKVTWITAITPSYTGHNMYYQSNRHIDNQSPRNEVKKSTKAKSSTWTWYAISTIPKNITDFTVPIHAGSLIVSHKIRLTVSLTVYRVACKATFRHRLETGPAQLGYMTEEWGSAASLYSWSLLRSPRNFLTSGPPRSGVHAAAAPLSPARVPGVGVHLQDLSVVPVVPWHGAI